MCFLIHQKLFHNTIAPHLVSRDLRLQNQLPHGSQKGVHNLNENPIHGANLSAIPKPPGMNKGSS